MATNYNPIFVKSPDNHLAGATDGTGANISLIYTADVTEGSYVDHVRLKPVSTIAATVARLWYCSATASFTPGTTNTAANTTLIDELSIAAWTASNTLASPLYIIPVKFVLSHGTKLLMTFGTSTGAGTTGFNPLIIAGKFV